MKIAVLCKESLSTDILLFRLAKRDNCEIVVLREAPLPTSWVVKFRLRRLGLVATLGQIAFMLIVPRLQARSARRRIDDLLAAHGLDRAADSHLNIEDVDTVNDAAVIERLKEFEPDVVLVNGTRIIRTSVLEAVPAPFINIHAGITPQYRGVHGGYWALCSDERECFGSTIHLVDKGVDTGQVLAHVRSRPTSEDNFSTYPVVQFLETLPVIGKILDDLPAALTSPPAVAPDVPSRQWYHPTLWQYIRGRLEGVK